jgi:predicted RNA binding protein YcfA (HicA-like mRNA interferase family)
MWNASRLMSSPIASPTESFLHPLLASRSLFQMSNWPASKAKRVLAALEKIGWQVKRQRGSHRFLTRPEWPAYEFAFHDHDEIGPRMLARIAKRTGLRPEDL